MPATTSVDAACLVGVTGRPVARGSGGALEGGGWGGAQPSMARRTTGTLQITPEQGTRCDSWRRNVPETLQQNHDDYKESQLAKENPIIEETSSTPSKEEESLPPTKEKLPEIPIWIKSNADWWASGSIDDQTFVGGIQFLIEQKIIEIDSVGQKTNTSSKIPQWIKSNADWWSKGLISDEDFLKGIKFLVENSIISVK